MTHQKPAAMMAIGSVFSTLWQRFEESTVVLGIRSRPTNPSPSTSGGCSRGSCLGLKMCDKLREEWETCF
jgi:hypothetical protein